MVIIVCDDAQDIDHTEIKIIHTVLGRVYQQSDDAADVHGGSTA